MYNLYYNTHHIIIHVRGIIILYYVFFYCIIIIIMIMITSYSDKYSVQTPPGPVRLGLICPTAAAVPGPLAARAGWGLGP